MSLFSKYCLSSFLLIFFLAPHGRLTAQETVGNDSLLTVSVTHSHGIRWTALRMGGGIGYGLFRDMGTAPISFEGVLVQPSLGLEFGGTRRYKTTIDLLTNVGLYEDALEPHFNFGSFDIASTLRFKMQRQFASPTEKIQLSYGFGGSCFTDVTVNTNYENAAVGVSFFTGPELSLRADYEFGWKWNMGIHAELGCMPLAALMRPGYSYIDNYTATHPVLKAQFDNYQWHLKPFGACFSEIGLNILELPYSHISICYHWEYHTTGGKGPWRFDHASHILTIDFYHTLFKRNLCETTVSRE